MESLNQSALEEMKKLAEKAGGSIPSRFDSNSVDSTINTKIENEDNSLPFESMDVSDVSTNSINNFNKIVNLEKEPVDTVTALTLNEEMIKKLPTKKDEFIDLSKLDIVEVSDIEIQNNISSIISHKKSSTSVICFQSGYQASLSAATFAELRSLRASVTSIYEQQKKMYRLIYDHIESMSIKKPSFAEWLKLTSYGDIQTLLFGMYSQTFTDSNSFTFKCTNEVCGKETTVEVQNESLINFKDDSIFKEREKILYSNPIESIKNSLVNHSERVLLNISKIVMELKIPTLDDHLFLLKSTPQNLLDAFPETIGTLVFLKKVLIPNVRLFNETGKLQYSPITNTETKFTILKGLTVEDGNKLSEEITKLDKKYEISYKIKGASCQHCKELFEPIEVNLEELLFLAMAPKKGL